MTGDQAADPPEIDEEDEDEEGLTEGERARRVAQLARYCVDNIACYRGGWAPDGQGKKQLIVKRNFWVRANGNFLDIAVLEWCKLFADTKGKHHFSRVFADAAPILDGLTQALGVDEDGFKALVSAVREYRDKFVAHLDDLWIMNIPATQHLLDGAIYLYDTMCTTDETARHLTGLYPDCKDFYAQRLAEATAEYRRAAPEQAA